VSKPSDVSTPLVRARRERPVDIYVALGWVAIFLLPDVARHGGLTALALLLAGGVLYTVGAACFAMRWPNQWPKQEDVVQ
jgi:hemolysin III